MLRGLERERTKRFPTMPELMVELAPPPVRSRTRVAATLAAAVVILGGTTAAAIKWGTPAPDLQPHEQPGTIEALHVIEKQLDEVKKQRDELERQLEAANVELSKLPAAQAVLDSQSKQIDDLLKQVVVLKRQLAGGAVPLTHNELVSRAVGDAKGDVQGCFQEWAERNPGVDAKLVVHVVVTGQGVGHDASAQVVLGPPKDGVVLGTCVAPAIERVYFPPSPNNEELDVVVTTAWAGGQLAMSTGVAHHSSLDNL